MSCQESMGFHQQKYFRFKQTPVLQREWHHRNNGNMPSRQGQDASTMLAAMWSAKGDNASTTSNDTSRIVEMLTVKLCQGRHCCQGRPLCMKSICAMEGRLAFNAEVNIAKPRHAAPGTALQTCWVAHL
jgi:hypothetical protein